MKKILVLLLSVMMVLALCACEEVEHRSIEEDANAFLAAMGAAVTTSTPEPTEEPEATEAAPETEEPEATEGPAGEASGEPSGEPSGEMPAAPVPTAGE